MQTYIEKAFATAVARNSPVIALDDSTQVVITSGPSRLAHKSPAKMIELALNSLGGASEKRIGSLSASASATLGAWLPVSTRAVGVIVRIAGARNTFRRGPVTVTLLYGNTVVDGTDPGGTAITTVTLYPGADTATALVLFTQDNRGEGQISSFTGIALEHAIGSNPGTVAGEYIVSIESVTARDFTNRENA